MGPKSAIIHIKYPRDIKDNMQNSEFNYKEVIEIL